MLPTNTLPLFGGASPILPPSLNYVLITLMREVGRFSKRSAEDRLAFDTTRAMALEVLHHHFKYDSHEQALEVIKKAWETRSQFGLYLRNFSLSSVNLNVTPEPGENDQYNAMTSTSFVDVHFQTALKSHLDTELSFIGIENPAYDPRYKNTLMKLSLNDDSWQEVVKRLIGAAAVILVLYEGPSPNVDLELDMLRELNRQPDTLIIKPAGDVLRSIDSVGQVRQAMNNYYQQRLEQSTATPETLSDFPNIVEWNETDEATKQVKRSLSGILKHPANANFTAPCPTPLPPRPPEGVIRWAGTSILAHKILAKAEMDKGNLWSAEDHVTAGLAMSFWSDNTEARAEHFLSLASLQWSQGKLGYAMENTERALDLCERVPGANSGLPDLAARLQRHLDQQSKVKSLLKRINALTGEAKRN